MCVKLIFTLLTIIAVNCERSKTIYQKLTKDNEFASFHDLIRTNAPAKTLLQHTNLTLFIPENQAFEEYAGYFRSDLAFYHMSYDVKLLRSLRSIASIESVNANNPPIWITKVDNSTDLYVNNAKILLEKSNHASRILGGVTKHQVLHVIDQVLDPVITNPTSSPTAYDFLTNTKNWQIFPYSVTSFLHKIQQNKLDRLYKGAGNHTFLIPIDSGIAPDKINRINKHVIYGHIIPNFVLFTRPTAKNIGFETLARDSYIDSQVQFTERNHKLIIQSTILSDSNNNEDYYAEIVRANIPVKNGVVHLISQPLGMSERKLKPFPYLSIMDKLAADPQLSTVYYLGEKTGFNKLLENTNQVFTYFVASDPGWNDLANQSLNLAEADYRMLGRHLIVSKIAYDMEKLHALTKARNYSDVTLTSSNGNLRMAVLKVDEVYFLKWNTKYIEVLRPNYECSNGIVHILRSPLGYFKRDDEDNVNFWGVIKRTMNL